MGISNPTAYNAKLAVAGNIVQLSNNAYEPQQVIIGASATAGAAPYFIFRRARGTYTVPTVLSNGDGLGSLLYGGYSGTAYVDTSSISSVVDGTVTSTNVPSALVFATGVASGTERMRIDSSGNVGIGTSSPSSKLEIAGTTVSVNQKITATTGGVYTTYGNTGSNFFVGKENSTSTAFGAPAYASLLYEQGVYPIIFYTSSAERMRIHASGGVSIGNTTDPSATNLSVTGTITGSSFSGAVAATTLSASSTVSGTGFSTYLASPPAIGGTSAAAGTFTQLTVNGSNVNTSISPTGTGTVTISPAGALTVNPTAASTINNTSIGATTASTGTFTTLKANTNDVTSVTAATSGLTANTTVTNTATFTTAGLTLATQTAAAGSVWRIRAYGQFTAASSATVRTAQIACFWGTTQLTAITPTVLASTAQTTQWQVEFELSATSTTAIWTTGSLMSRVASATALAIDNATAASTTVTAGAQTLDLQVRVSSAIAAESWIIQQITMERIK